jgi:hypothetical protein
MSRSKTRIIFWKPREGCDAWHRPDPSQPAVGNAWADALRNGQAVAEVEPFAPRLFVDSVLQAFPEAWEENGSVIREDSDGHFVLHWSDYHVEATCFDLWVVPSEKLVEIATDLGLDWFDFRV